MTAATIGYVIGLLAIPAAGAAMIIAGIVQRSRSTRPQPPHHPQYPPQGWPPAYPPPGWPAPPPHQSMARPGGHYYPPVPPVPPGRAKPRGTALIVIGAVLVGLAVLGSIGRAASNNSISAGGFGGGDCIRTPDFVIIGEIEPVDCDDPAAAYELASESEAKECPDGPSDQTDYFTLQSGGETACYVPNLVEGRCYTRNDLKNKFTLVDCNAQREQLGAGDLVTVVKRVDGSTDTSDCSGADTTLSFPEPARVYCLDKT